MPHISTFLPHNQHVTGFSKLLPLHKKLLNIPLIWKELAIVLKGVPRLGAYFSELLAFHCFLTHGYILYGTLPELSIQPMHCCALLLFFTSRFYSYSSRLLHGTGAIIWLPQCQWSNHEEYWDYGTVRQDQWVSARCYSSALAIELDLSCTDPSR